MFAASLTRISEVDFTATLKQGPEAVEVTDESKIPNAFWIPVPPKLDKQSLRAALRSGDAIEGAMLSEPKPVLQVRIA